MHGTWTAQTEKLDFLVSNQAGELDLASDINREMDSN